MERNRAAIPQDKRVVPYPSTAAPVIGLAIACCAVAIMLVLAVAAMAAL